MQPIPGSTEASIEHQREVINNVIPMFGLRRIERVGGIAVALGSMGYEELMSVYMNCQDRATLANTEADLVAIYLDSRFPGDVEPPDAA